MSTDITVPGTEDLKNKPLLEAILEVQWELESATPGMGVDPHYKILLGSLYDRVRDLYPEHEELPTASIPDEMSPHLVKHRFRRAPNGWPLMQIGPGIMTVNDTQGYTWPDFSERARTAIEKLFASYPKPSALKVQSLLLRYVDAVDFDIQTNDVFDFLKDKMRVAISLPADLFADGSVTATPWQFNWQASFGCQRPKGMVQVRFATGTREKKPVLLWETMVLSGGDDVPSLPAGFSEWIEAAHCITHAWFFRLIKGELERRFRGE
jgi:uncharacterized protein (TIGR04255 family)